MANVFIEESILQEWADNIRYKTQKADKMLPSEMLEITKTFLPDLSALAEELKYFSYQLDIANKQIVLCSVLYNKLYEDTGSYDINVPDEVAGFNVLIMANS